MRYPSDMHHCPLLEKEIFWGGEGGCVEIQEVREDNMDAEFLPFELDIERANDICEKCRWCYVNESEYKPPIFGKVVFLPVLLGQRKSHYAVTDSRGHNAQDVRTSA